VLRIRILLIWSYTPSFVETESYKASTIQAQIDGKLLYNMLFYFKNFPSVLSLYDDKHFMTTNNWKIYQAYGHLNTWSLKNAGNLNTWYLKNAGTLNDYVNKNKQTFDGAHRYNGCSGAPHYATTIVAVRHITLQRL
jgi:hypothetical protein